MSESPKLTPDELGLRLEPDEVREVEDELMPDVMDRAILGEPKPRTTERSGFARHECIRGKHPIGTQAGCPSCEAYKATAVVRK